MATATAAVELTGAKVSDLEVSAYEIPTDRPESDGTLEWNSTTVIIVEVEAAGERGLGYTYGDVSVATFIRSKLADVVEGSDPLQNARTWSQMRDQVRNAGRPGVGAMAVSAVDIALWDLKARLLGVCLADALPRFHERAPIYGSGGFTSYSADELRQQAELWREAQLPRVKIKVGRDPEADPGRLAVVREAIGPDVELMVDANGAFTPQEALRACEDYARFDVAYCEEPVSSEDLNGMRFVRERAPRGMRIAAGEYGWDLPYFEQMLDAQAVDILQADVTRCGGITNMLRVDGMLKGRSMPFSAHCVPAVSAHAGSAMETLEHIEYFHDHVRIERMLFDGTTDPDDGFLEPDRDRPGLGLELRRSDAKEYEL